MRFKSKFFIGILISVILASSFLSALELQIKPEFKQGETLFAKVSGNFVDIITSQNISLYQEHERVSFVPHVKRIQEDFYIYGQTSGKPEGNYSLRIENIRHYSTGNVLSSEDIVLNFKITNETADFSVDSLIFEGNQNFSVKVENLFLDKKINVTSTFINAEKTTLLSYGELKELEFLIPSSTSSELEILELESGQTSYEAYVIVSSPSIVNPPEEMPEIEEGGVGFRVSEIDIDVILSSTDLVRFIRIYNPWDYELKKVSVSVSEDLKDYIKLKNTSVNIPADSEIKIYYEILPGDSEKEVQGNVTVQTSKVKSILPFELSILEEFIPEPYPEDNNSGEQPTPNNCIVKGSETILGKICSLAQECNGTLYLSEGQQEDEEENCCIGTCVVITDDPQAKPSISTERANKIVGWVLVLFLIGFIAWFILKKYRGAKRPIDLLKIGKGKNSSKSSTGKLGQFEEEKVGLGKEFDANDLPSEIRSSLDSSSKKKK